MNGKQFIGMSLSIVATVMIAAGILSPTISFAGVTTNAIGANEVIPNTCIPQVANTLITFPSTQPGGSASTSNAENVINYGNAASNILVFGVNWISTGGNAFHVSNTLWDGASHGSNIGNALTNTAVDTLIPMKANGGANVIFFGLNVPSGQLAGTYNQLLTIEGSC